MKVQFLFALSLLTINASAKDKVNPFRPDFSHPSQYDGMKLVFSEEFNSEGKPDSTIWNYEKGFQRNQELQWYQAENANCTGGRLLIEGKRENKPNPHYREGSDHWRHSRKTIEYTASSITTEGKKEWKYGRFEIRARIDTVMGSWPAIWLLGRNKEWPWCGEIDMLEFYHIDNVPTILANVVSGTNRRWDGRWDSEKIPLMKIAKEDKDWVKKFHVWRMDWSADSIDLYLDNKMVNTTLVTDARNPDGTLPFREPQYMLLNLALGSNGGDPSNSKFPITFEVDYVRVYQKINDIEQK